MDGSATAGRETSRGATARVSANVAADVAAAILAASLDVVAADAGFVATVAGDGRTLDVARVTPFSPTPVRLEFPVEAPYPLAETIRTGRPLFIANNEELLCDHPGLVRVKSEDHACATLPLFDDDGELLGAVNLGYDEPHSFTAAELEVIDLIARHCARAMSLARELELELGRRRTAAPAEAS